MDIKAEWVGYEDLMQDLATLTNGMQGQALRSALRAAAKPVVQDAKAHAGSSRVRAALRAIVAGRGLLAEARIGAAKGTAGLRLLHLLERGTRPHLIRPKKRRRLAIYATLAGRATGRAGHVITGNVQHPGAKARPFFRAALPNQEAEARRKFMSALRQIVGSMQLRLLKKRGLD